MQKRPINRNNFLLDAANINEATEVTGFERVIYCSGQTSIDAEGTPMYPGDLTAQFKTAWENLLEVLKRADMGPENIIRLNFYTTDVPGLMERLPELAPLYRDAGCTPSCTLLGVTALFLPELMVEIEATAVA